MNGTATGQTGVEASDDLAVHYIVVVSVGGFAVGGATVGGVTVGEVMVIADYVIPRRVCGDCGSVEMDRLRRLIAVLKRGGKSSISPEYNTSGPQSYSPSHPVPRLYDYRLARHPQAVPTTQLLTKHGCKKHGTYEFHFKFP